MLAALPRPRTWQAGRACHLRQLQAELELERLAHQDDSRACELQIFHLKAELEQMQQAHRASTGRASRARRVAAEDQGNQNQRENDKLRGRGQHKGTRCRLSALAQATPAGSQHSWHAAGQGCCYGGYASP